MAPRAVSRSSVRGVIGSTVGHYRILDKLGEGGMGIVYLAEDQLLKRKVALKMLPPSVAEDPHRLARFEREVKTVAALNHPNIVTIYSVEEADGYRFFTMEYIEGMTLSQLIPRRGMPLGDFLEIAVPLADALAAAHEKGVIHRDIKPSNVMVGNDGRVKVLDFGLAKLREHEAAELLGAPPETTLTQERLALGTLAYMAPEQLRSLSVDHRSDIFSLGVVLFEMATGHCPFIGQSSAEVISSILRDQPARVYEENGRVPLAIDAVLRRCLEKVPDERLASARELRDALAAVAKHRSMAWIGRVVGSVRHGIGRLRGWHRWTIAAATVAALLAVAISQWPQREASTTTGGAAIAPVSNPSLVLLPLTSPSGEPEYFVDGMTDGLIASLARLQGIRVISRHSAMHYKGSNKPLPEIARELGVDYLVKGVVLRRGESVELETQLVRAAPEATIWSGSFQQTAPDVLALESSFAAAVTKALDVRLSGAETAQLGIPRTVNPSAYEAYLQGRYWAGKHSAESFRRAQGHFERAIALDSGFAPAWTGLAEVHQKLGYFFDDLDERLAQTEIAVRKALEIEPSSGAAHAALGDLYLARWKWRDGEAEIRRAVELEPGSAIVHLNYWRLLMRLRRFDEALREIVLAQQLDPLSANIAANYGLQLGLMGSISEAFAAFDHALGLDPEFGLVHAYAWIYYHRLGKDPERGRELRAWLEAGGFGDFLPEFDRRLATAGYPAALAWIADRLDASPDRRNVRPGIVAGLLACADQPDRAMRWLERGFEHRDWEMAWIATTPDFESLHGREDFRRLVRKLGLPEPPLN